MAFSSFDPVTQEDRLRTLNNDQQREKELKDLADPNIAKRVGEIYRDAPYIPPSVILAMAKNGTSPETVEAIKKTAATKAAQGPKPKKKGWFQETIYDNVKAASRWSFAALRFVPDVLNNAASQVMSPNNPAGFDGWFKSTQLGTLMSNTQEAGEGFFLSEEAMEKQAERARRFRGTIDDSAWTIGRSAADVLFTPGSKPYSLLSGFIDAAVEVTADPTLVAGKALKTARAGRAAVPGISTADEIAGAKALARRTAGLSSAEAKSFQQSDFAKFVLNDTRAQRFRKRLLENATNTSKTVEEKTLFVMENWPGISPAKAREFAEAADDNQILGLLGEASARITNNPDDILLPQDIRDVRLARGLPEFLDGIKERSPIARGISLSRYFQTMPKGSVVINGTGAEKREAVLSYARYLRGVGLSDETNEFKEVMQKVVAAYSSTDPITARAASKQAYEDAFAIIASKAGFKSKTQKQFIEGLISSARDASSRIYSLSEEGVADDGGAFQLLREYLDDDVLEGFTPDVLDRLVISGPGALNELTQEIQLLPDFRQLRALAGNPWFTRSAKTGNQRQLAAAFESIQQDFWKPLTLATGGYIMRNMLDAQTRMAMGGYKSIFRHPQDYIMWVLRKKGGFDIKGENFASIARDVPKEQKQLYQALTFDLHKNLQDPLNAERAALRNGSFSIAGRGADAGAHTTGYVDNLALLWDEDVVERRIARLMVEGLDQPTRVQRIKEWLKQPENANDLSQIRDYFRTGVEVFDPVTAQKKLIPINVDDDDLLSAWVDRLASSKVNTITRNNENLNMVVAFNRVPIMQTAPNGRLVAVGKVDVFVDDLDPENLITGGDNVGDIIRLSDGNEGVIVRKVEDAREGIDPFTGKAFTPETKLVVQPVHPTTAFTADGLGTNQLRELIDDMGNNGELAEFVKRAERGIPAGDPNNKLMQARDTFVDFFFVNLYGTLTQRLEKSPVFRQSYYKTVVENADLMSPQAAQELLQRATVNAGEIGIKLENYLGGREVLETIQEVAESSSKAIGTLEQLDAYAKAIALNETKTLLYNATERSNLEDVMRVIVPFGAAWREVLSTYAKAVIEDPTRLRSAQRIVTGGERVDMGIFGGTEGQGFFYKDATTGEYSFNFPLSSSISKLLTGTDTALQAPLKRISIGLGVVPSIGPMAQIAASRIIPDTPSMDLISSILLPYGEKTSMQITPMWLTRLTQALEANTLNLETVYGNTYVETLRALSASGEYDLSNFDEQEKLYADARNKARIIAVLRTVGQFIGPTSPSPEFKIETKQGDIYATQLVKEFQKLQDPNSIAADGQPGNYDTAVKRFLEIYGNDAILYLSNKTESVAGGLEATDEFGDWERTEGKGLINKYRDTAGFMAPGGDDFSFEVWSRQIEKGLRRRLSDREIVELAQYRAASAQYRELRDKLPANPTADQKAWLRQWRKKLNQEYPGFPVVAEFNPGEFPGKIEQLSRLVAEPVLADNDIAKATRTYLKARQNAIQQYINAGGAESGFKTAQSAANLREWLVGVGKTLREQVPEFSRIYDRLLSAEIEE